MLGVANGVWDKISAAMGGSGVVKWNDILEKPFYTEENALIFEAEFNDTLKDSDGDGENDSWEGQMIFKDDSEATLEPGKVYTINWNGEEYECICRNFQGLPVIGNYMPFGEEDTGEPFLLIRDKNNLFGMGKAWAAVLINVPEDITLSGTYSCWIVGEKVKQLESKYIPEPPVFDLGAMGLSTFSAEGGAGELETDTTEIWKALEKGAVTFGIPIAENENVLTVYFTAHGFTDGANMYQCVGMAGLDEMLVITVMVFHQGVMAGMVPFSMVTGIPEVTESDNGKVLGVVGGAWEAMEAPAGGENAVAASVDLSAYESGTITETYPDGGVITYSFEFDSEGNPTKMTDSNGNETTFIW